MFLLPFKFPKAEPCGEVNYGELFECVDINKFSNADLQVAAVICRKLCEEVCSSHKTYLPHVRGFGEKAVQKLVHADLSKPSIPVALRKRLPLHRNDMVFSFSYRFHTAQLRSGSSVSFLKSPCFLDERCKVKWCVDVLRKKRKRNKHRGYLVINLRRSFEGSAREEESDDDGEQEDDEDEEEESEFGNLIYAELGNGIIFSQTTKKNVTTDFAGGASKGYANLVPYSVLNVKDTVKVGVVVYFKAK